MGTGDSRREDRAMAVLISGAIRYRGSDRLCRIRNLSPHGMMIECGFALAEGDRVDVGLRSGRSVPGQVRWRDGDRAGLSFETEDAMALVQERPPVAPTGKRVEAIPAHPRFARCAEVRLRSGDARISAVLCDLSLSDLCVTIEEPMATTSGPWTVSVDGLGDHLATITRLDEDRFLLSLTQPFPYRLLDSWLTGAV